MQLILGDCLEKMKDIPDGSIDAIITDPPYGLGFMGKEWDKTGIANNKEMWVECLRVLKPGGYLLAFGGTRTYHRMAVAIEDAGFEVRDMIEWVYGSGFPKSLNIGKAVDKLQGNEREVVGKIAQPGSTNKRLAMGNGWQDEPDLTKGTSEWEGWGTALKPAHEPICMARKPLAEKTVAENVLKYGTGGINIDGCRVGTEERYNAPAGNKAGGNSLNMSALGMPQDAEGTTAIGRFPANLIHDNSEEVRECFPETKGAKETTSRIMENPPESWKQSSEVRNINSFADSGNASRFFKSIIYQAKASKSERNKGCEGLEEKPKVFNGQSDKPSTDMKDVEKRFTTLPKANNHPTVKPIALIEYLITMVTPKGGIVLDPFAGSGTTGVACKNLNREFIGIELDPTYYEIAVNRISSLSTNE